MLPSGVRTVFYDRVGWAKTYLKQAGLLDYPKRGYFRTTEEGRKVLTENPDHIDDKFLQRYPAFKEFKAKKKPAPEVSYDDHSSPSEQDETPSERLYNAYLEIKSALAAELLDRVRASSPDFFEDLILNLLRAMGYGGVTAKEDKDRIRGLGKSGDGGVDGVIDQDLLGVDQVYVQAKRYAEDNKVASREIRDFFGALNLKKAQKGIFFTTSEFTKDAEETAQGLGVRIALINGDQLAELMIEYSVGCRREDTLYLKTIDDEFFDSE